MEFVKTDNLARRLTSLVDHPAHPAKDNVPARHT
jgi:hypothetical protein